jgi:GxxExxY protein
MLIELKQQGIQALSQASINVHYEGKIVGEFFADLFVENSVIVELKSVRRVIQAHEVQLVNYLTATKTDVGLLLNFADKKVEVKRKTRKLLDQPGF